jgi:hypothetical protein
MAFLETFWDADVPRFGDPAANGLAQWLALKQMGNQAASHVQSHALNEPPADELAAMLATPLAPSASDDSEALVAQKWAAVENNKNRYVSAQQQLLI